MALSQSVVSELLDAFRAGEGVDLVRDRLARHRPIFHSEADFQNALAWQLQWEDPADRV